MDVVIVVAGVLLLAAAGYFARRAGELDARLVSYRTSQHRGGESHWPAPADSRYRLEGWPLVTALRHALAWTYALAFIGVICLQVSCPRMHG
jgi:hypothetical protein